MDGKEEIGLEDFEGKIKQNARDLQFDELYVQSIFKKLCIRLETFGESDYLLNKF